MNPGPGEAGETTRRPENADAPASMSSDEALRRAVLHDPAVHPGVGCRLLIGLLLLLAVVAIALLVISWLRP